MIYRIKAWIGKHAPWRQIYTHWEMDELRANAVGYEMQRRWALEAAIKDGFPGRFGGGELVSPDNIARMAEEFKQRGWVLEYESEET